MADLTVIPGDVAPVLVIEQITAPALEDIDAGQYVGVDADTGKLTLSDGPGGAVALRTVRANETVTAVRYGIVDVGDALDALDFGAEVYADGGTLADDGDDVIGTVVPGWGHTTADKLLRVA